MATFAGIAAAQPNGKVNKRPSYNVTASYGKGYQSPKRRHHQPYSAIGAQPAFQPAFQPAQHNGQSPIYGLPMGNMMMSRMGVKTHSLKIEG